MYFRVSTATGARITEVRMPLQEKDSGTSSRPHGTHFEATALDATARRLHAVPSMSRVRAAVISCVRMQPSTLLLGKADVCQH